MSDYDIRLDVYGDPETPENVSGLRACGHSLTAPTNNLAGLRL